MKTTTFKKKSGLGGIAALAGLAYGASKLMGGGPSTAMSDAPRGVVPGGPEAIPPKGMTGMSQIDGTSTQPPVLNMADMGSVGAVAPAPRPVQARAKPKIVAPPAPAQTDFVGAIPSANPLWGVPSPSPSFTSKLLPLQTSGRQAGMTHRADGGTVDTCCNTEPRRSSRSFPKKGG